MSSEKIPDLNHKQDEAELKKAEEQVGLQNKAPDGGWGWVVVFGSFMIHVIADGVAYSFGIYVESFLDHFNANRSEVGFLGSLMLGVTWGTGPIASMLTNKYGCQKVAISGTLIAATGFIISIFAPNIYFMYFSFGIVAGFGLGMAYLPAIVAVSFYFEKRRSFATGLAVCGSGVGTFIFAPLTQMLLDEYGWKGTVLIETGILLNCILCGAVFRPLPALQPALANSPSDPEKGTKESQQKTALIVQGEDKRINETKAMFNTGVLQPLLSGSSSSLAMRKQAIRNTNLDQKISSSETHLASNEQNGNKEQKRAISSGISSGSLPKKDLLYTSSVQSLAVINAAQAETRRMSVQRVSTPEPKRGCPFWGMIGCSDEMISSLKEMMDCRLMIDVVFQLFAISNLLTSIGLCVPYVFLPDRATMMGISESEAAFLISIVGISNTVGRIVFGFLADFKWVNHLMLYNTVLVLCGVCSLLSALCHNYPLMATYSATFGLFIGVYICLTPIVLVDLMGLERLSNAFGLVLLYQGIGAVIGPPMAGAIYDSTLDYNDSFYLMGICIAVSGAMLYVIPLIEKYRNRRNPQKTEENVKTMTFISA